MKTIKDFFIEKISYKYSVTENLARFFYDKWQVEKKCYSEDDIDNFLKSETTKKLFFIAPGINIVKKYTLEELKKLGIELSTVIEADKRIYRDNKYNFAWQEQYHGFSEAYTGLYQIINLNPGDKELCGYEK